MHTINVLVTCPIFLVSQPRPPTSGVLIIHSGNTSLKPTNNI